jgi:tetratricopeptide (TPR) repeat protein
MKSTPSLIFLVLLLVLPWSAQGQTSEEIIAEAHALFHQASDETEQATAQELYRQALLRYEQVYRRQPAAGLAYNIGNTYYRLGDLGRALLHYRRAEQEMVGDANLRHNLAVVRAQLPAQVAAGSTTTAAFNLHRRLPLELRTRIFLGLHAAFWLAAALWYRKKPALPAWVPLLLLTATLLVSTSVGLDKMQPPARQGVIIAPEIVARQGDGRNYQAAFAAPLTSGTEFVLRQKRGYWLQIELADGRLCWIPTRSAELI